MSGIGVSHADGLKPVTPTTFSRFSCERSHLQLGQYISFCSMDDMESVSIICVRIFTIFSKFCRLTVVSVWAMFFRHGLAGCHEGAAAGSTCLAFIARCTDSTRELLHCLT